MTGTLRRGLAAGLALILCLSLPALAREPDYPALTGRVVDQAGILSEQAEQNLTGWLEGFERDTGRQVVVATIGSLENQPIEDYGVGLGRKWGIGEKGKDTGAILLVAPNDRQVRIEVGYGLEGELTDAVSSTIIQQQILPYFRQGDFEGGIVNGIAAILGALGWTGGPQVRPAAPQGGGDHPELGSLIFFGLILVFVIFRNLFGVGRGRRPGIWGTSSRGWGGGGWSSGGGGFSSGGGGFSGGGGSFGGGGATGRW